MGENQNTVKEFLKNVDDLGSNALSVSRKMLQGGKEEVTLNLKRTKIMPERMESPARAHIFHNETDFTKYILKNKTTETVIFANVADYVIFAVLNDKADLGFEKIVFKPLYHPEFVLLMGTLLDTDMPIMKFARNLMRNRNVLAGNIDKSKQLAMLMQQITVSSKITAYTGVGAKSVNGIMCTTEAKAGVAEEQIDLPDSIAVDVPIYINTDPVRFNIDLTITVERTGEVNVITDSPEVAVRKYEIFQGIMENIRKIEGVLVTMGKPMTINWEYNK